MLALLGVSLISLHTKSLILGSYCALWHRPHKVPWKQSEAVRAVKEAGLLQGR